MIFGSTEIAALRVGGSEVSKVYLGATEVWSSSFDPLSLSPAIWFDASDAATLYDATSGGSLVAADGTIARWEDKSGNARHATQSTSGSRPIRKTALQNGLDAARFDGADWMVTSAFTGDEEWTQYVVFVRRSDTYSIVVAQGSGYETPNPGADYLAYNSMKIESSINGGSGTSALSQRVEATGTATIGDWKCTGQFAASTHAGHILRVNGVAPSVDSPQSQNPGTYSKASTALGLGAFNDGSAPSQLDLGEVIRIPRALTTDERDALESYLLTKWGI